MGQMARVKMGLRQAAGAIVKMRKDIDNVKAKGQNIDRYSLGFTNGVIFAEHAIAGHPGKARTYNDELTIGEGVPYPRPVKFDQDAAVQEELEKKIDQIFIASRQVVELFAKWGAQADLGEAIITLGKSIEAYGDMPEEVPLNEPEAAE